jgi:NAD(P)-dependent dehydrogenase (short-subunit alcohol dehydrogenase family)
VEIQGRTAIVTGAAHGIGRAIAGRLANGGARMLVVDLDESGGREVVRELRATGADAASVAADVTVEEEVARMVETAVRELGGLDILVNNAGGYDEPVFPDAPIAHWSRALDLNLRSVMLAIHAAVPVLEPRGGGAIVNIASSAGLGFSSYGGPEYAAAKAAVMRLTGSLAWLADRGIRVNCVCPHTVATETVRRTIADLEAAGEPLPTALQDELLEPEEVAEHVAMFVADGTLAGRVLVCRGGEPPQLLPVD